MGNICSDRPKADLRGIALFFVGFLFFVWSLTAGTTGIFALVAGILAASAPILTAIIMSVYDERIPRMNPQRLLSECKDKWEGLKNAKSEIEQLEIVYNHAIEVSYEAFKEFFSTWIASGIALAVMIIGIIRGWFISSTVVQLSGVILSLVGTASFILMIFSYLRYRDYTKQLLAIQLKKTDKAELSIKL